MILNVYAIRDIQTAQFLTPMFLINHGHVKRQFSDQVNTPEEGNPLYKHPEDFELYHLGEFDTDKGEFKTGRPEQIETGKSVKR